MKASTKDKLHEAWAYCDEQDKSAEFMLQYMSDVSGVEYARVVDFVVDTPTEEVSAWRVKNKQK